MSTRRFLEVHQKVIYDLMGPDWFSRPKYRIEHHPAFEEYSLCERFINQTGLIHWPDDQKYLKPLCSTLLDTVDIVRCSGDHFDQFDFKTHTLGSFAGFGDEKSRLRIKAAVGDPSIFSSLLTELSFAAWCKTRNYEVTPFEKEGYPDFKVRPDQLCTSYLVECKKLLIEASKNRISKITSKANKQIKAVDGSHYGVVIIDATLIIENPEEFSDDIPEDISFIKSLIEKSIINSNTAISGVILVWNDYALIGNPYDELRSRVVFRKRKILIQNQNAIITLPANTPFDEYGSTVTFSVEFTRQKPFRNSRCECGSGLRYKHCCGVIAR